MKSIILTCLTALLAYAEWSSDPGSPLDLGTGIMPELAATDDGGLYVAWLTEGSFNIYLQRLDASGTPQWADGGLLISDQAVDSWIAVFHLNLVVDGEGNAIVSCIDIRSGSWEVYAYKIAPDGHADWGENGLTLSSSGGDNLSPRLVVIPEDNSVVVTWCHDYSSLRYQRIAADGSLLWGANGIAISDFGGNLLSPKPFITNDQSVRVQWIRQTGSFPMLSSEVKLQDYSLNGTALWWAISINAPVAFPMGNWAQDAEADNLGGSYSSWTELNGTNQTGKVQYLDENGDLNWVAPVEVSTMNTHFRISPQLAVEEEDHSVYAVWRETDASQTNRGIYAQLISPEGARQWGGPGVAIEAMGSDVFMDIYVSEVSGDVMTAYIRENSFGSSDIYASRLDSSGFFVWDGDIVAVSSSGAWKTDLLGSSGPGCTFLAWSESGSIRANCLLDDGVLGAPVLDAPAIINVPADFATIQLAIDAAIPGDTVLVQPGIYFENIDFSGKDITLASLTLMTGDTAYISQTIIDGGNVSTVVVLENGESAAANLLGFTIRNGTGYLADPDGDGDSAYYGGGIYVANSSPSFSQLKIKGNSVTNGGGGGLFFQASNSRLNRIVFENNISEDVGGGFYARANSDLIIKDSKFINNHCADVGGAFYARDGSDIILDRTLIIGNSSAHAGGGVGFKNDCYPVISFTTFANNQIAHYGSAIYSNNSFPVVVNCILWDNQIDEVYFANFGDPSEIVFAYTDIQQGIDGINTSDNGTVVWEDGNLDQYPAFADTSGFDYNLTLNSPCVDAGTTFYAWAGDTLVDLEQESYNGSAPDMGVYESLEDTLNYFPLILGQQWTYASDLDTFSISLVYSQIINEQVYFEFDSWFPGESFNGFRTEGNQVYVWGETSENMLYDFAASLGETWIYMDPHQDPSTMTMVSIGDTVETQLGIFTDCYQIHRFIGADYEYDEWFASEVGLVQRDVITFAGPRRYSLIREGPIVSNDETSDVKPERFDLSQNYPNPFNPTTNISYSIPQAAYVSLAVYDLTGRKLANLKNEQHEAGKFSVLWNGLDDSGMTVSAGIYLCQLQTGSNTGTIKMVILK
ncbi:T9SS type A sorting domain-containing protein [bacterium]|nr:T9SS type A sorting domain-containing protein [bacterium]